jgi:hypothetical protein
VSDTGIAHGRGRRIAALLIAGCLAAGAVALLGQQLLPALGGPGEQAEPARPISAEEAARLARMRKHNYDDHRAGVRATIGTGPAAVHLAGWVDWRQPMVYLARSGPEPGKIAELVQAVPGLVATRPGDPPTTDPQSTLVDPHPPPPPEPPARGWSLRSLSSSGPAGDPASAGTLDALVQLLLTVTADEPDSPTALAGTESQWLRQDQTAGYEVDVLLGPAIPPSEPPADTSLASMGGAVQYWLDGHGRLHRLDALLAPEVPVDLDRADRTAPTVLDALGGAAIDPRPVTKREARELAQLRPRNLAAGGGEIRLAIPTEDGGTVTGAGWLDWRRTIAYVRTRGTDKPRLLWADAAGVATRKGRSEGQLPPVPVPLDDRWKAQPWEERGDEQGGFDLDLLLNEALSLSGPYAEAPRPLRQRAAWLRADTLDGRPVTVYEIPREIESEVAPGAARMRYWLDDETGSLVRLEIRTRSGGFGQLTITPGPIPVLG